MFVLNWAIVFAAEAEGSTGLDIQVGRQLMAAGWEFGWASPEWLGFLFMTWASYRMVADCWEGVSQERAFKRLDYWLIVKVYNSSMARWKGYIWQSMWEGAWSFHTLLEFVILPTSSYVHQPGSSNKYSLISCYRPHFAICEGLLI